MFTCDMSESQQKTIPLNGVEATVAAKLIDYAYTSGTGLKDFTASTAILTWDRPANTLVMTAEYNLV